MHPQYKHVKANRRNIKEKLFAAFGGKCACCGLVDDPIAYDFHHINPDEKDFTIAKLARSWEKVVQEAVKCVMLCAICHRKLHANLITLPDNVMKFDESFIPSSLIKKKSPKVKIIRKPRALQNRPSNEELSEFLKTHSTREAARFYKAGKTTIYRWSLECKR
jgi:hypothetical protein